MHLIIKQWNEDCSLQQLGFFIIGEKRCTYYGNNSRNGLLSARIIKTMSSMESSNKGSTTEFRYENTDSTIRA